MECWELKHRVDREDHRVVEQARDRVPDPVVPDPVVPDQVRTVIRQVGSVVRE
jgi:hypothetical protein